MEQISVLIVKGNDPFLSTLSSVLRQRADFDVLGVSQDSAGALKKAQVLHPDIMLIDVHLPEMDGLDFARQIKSVVPDVKIILYTREEKDKELQEAMIDDLQGYLPKHIGPEGFCRALRVVAQGQIAITRIATGKLLKELGRLMRSMPYSSTCLKDMQPPSLPLVRSHPYQSS